MIPYQTIVIACAIGVLPVAAWMWVVIKYNQKHQRGISFLLNIFFLGVLSAIPASVLEIMLNESDSDNQLLAAMQQVWAYQEVSTVFAAVISSGIVAAIEEFSKGIGIIIGVFSKKFRIHNDGLIFGALVGLAFAVTENGVYFASAITSESSAGVSSIIILRFILSTTAHIIYSGLFGKFIADAYLEKDATRKTLNYIKAFLIPVLVHSAFNLLLTTSFSWLVVVIIMAGIFGLWYFYNKNSLEKEALAEEAGAAEEIVY